FGVSAATDGMVESDRETGNDRSWGDFALGLAAPVAGLAAGMDAAAVIGPSAFTTTVVPAIITGGGIRACRCDGVICRKRYPCKERRV
ncbi:hypothetical protein, partial [Roseburia sp. 1XD42-69]|uniref:hypothetical protein n=1 Tax=Roseburia sp. 1XD42-69 TaxID=2320088 RepID=UPI000EE14B98